MPQLFLYLEILKKKRQKEQRRRNLYFIRNFMIFSYSNNQEKKKQHQDKDTLKKCTSFSLRRIYSIKYFKTEYTLLV